jgi:hypothetical protein
MVQRSSDATYAAYTTDATYTTDPANAAFRALGTLC